jgi:pimeloyl-ACP methyl ester carboxylesterase
MIRICRAARALGAGALAAALLAGCASSPAEKPEPVTPAAESSPTAVAEPVFPFEEDTQGPITYVEYMPGYFIAVVPSEAETPSPSVVIVHGFNVEPTFYHKLAKALAKKGMTVYIPDWRDRLPSNEDPRTTTVTEGLDDVADALRFVRTHAERYGSDPDNVVIVGHSLGAVAALDMMLAGDSFGSELFPKTTSAVPDAYVSLDGVVPFKELLWSPEFRALYKQDPVTWGKLNPDTYLDDSTVGEGRELRFFVATLDGDKTKSLAKRLKRRGYKTKVSTLDVEHLEAAEPQPATVKAITALARAKSP